MREPSAACMPQPLLTSAACTLRAGGLLEEVEGESRGQEATYRARCILVDTEPKVRSEWIRVE